MHTVHRSYHVHSILLATRGRKLLQREHLYGGALPYTSFPAPTFLHERNTGNQHDTANNPPPIIGSRQCDENL